MVAAPLSLLSFMLLISFFCSCFAADTCSYTNEQGESWDLSTLTYHPASGSPPGYSFSDPSRGDTFFVNFCDAVSELDASRCNESGAAGACQQSIGNFYSLGEVQETLFVDYISDGTYTSGIGIQYSDGNLCTQFGVNRTSTIYVSCDADAGVGELYSATEDQCSYTFYFRSAYGCSINSGSPTGPSSCVYEVGTDVFDLTALRYNPDLSSPVGYSIVGSDDHTYYLNFCDEVSTELEGCNPGDTESAVCQKSGDIFYPSGKVTNTTVVNFIPSGALTQGIGLEYKDGQYCPNYGELRFTTVYVGCDPTSEGELVSASSLFCRYTLYFKSKYGCPNLSKSPSPIPSASASPSPSPSSSASSSSSSSSSASPSPSELVSALPSPSLSPSPSPSPSEDGSTANPCQFINSNGTLWNLSYLAYDPAGIIPSNYNLMGSYFVNFCKEIGNPTGYNCNSRQPSGACIAENAYEVYSIGNCNDYSFQSFIPNDLFHSGIGLVYNNGEHCGNGTYTTLVNVACDITAGTGDLYDVYQNNTCQWVFEFRSIYGCGVQI